MCNERVLRATLAFGYTSSPLFFFRRFQSDENRAKKEKIAVEHPLAPVATTYSQPSTHRNLLTAIHSICLTTLTAVVTEVAKTATL